MIVQALVAYYDRLAREGNVAPMGWQMQPIGWVVHLTAEGGVKALECTYERQGKREVAKTFCVPAHLFGGRSGATTSPYLLWDTAAYALGVGDKRTAEKLEAFTQRVEALGVETLKPLVAFLRGNPAQALAAADAEAFARLGEDKAPIVTFRLAGDDGIVCARQDVRAAYDAFYGERTKGDTLCLATGRRGALSLIAPKTQLPGANSSGCSLISFQKNQGFDSYGKEQGANAPLVQETTFRYTTALQALIDAPEHRLRVGEETLLFWANEHHPVEDAIANLFGWSPSSETSEDNTGALAVKGILTAAQKGRLPAVETQERFWFLLLQPVAARIAVRLWVEQTPTETAANLVQWFGDLNIIRPSYQKGAPPIISADEAPLSVYALLVALSPLGDTKRLPPRLGGDLLRAALQNGRLPDIVAQNVLRRLRSENVTPTRAALLKAWLLRKDKDTSPNHSTERKPTVMLDLENDNPGYCLGRLFAVLEKTQKEALGDVNASIKDKFYATASADPAAVFGTLLRNNAFHTAKLETGRQIYFEKLKGEICGHLAEIPAHLGLADQARFALGYYHQLQSFFTKKSTSPETANEPTQETLPLE